MANRQEFFFPSSDGAHQVHGVLWLPESGEPKAVVQIIHGICEYALRYDPFAIYLTERGYAVAGSDHLGHGQTATGSEEYGFFTDWFQLTKDQFSLRKQIGRQYPKIPYFLLGHSMGSFQARTYLIDYPGTVDGCILSGTGQESAATVAMGKLVTGIGDPHKVNTFFQKLSLDAYNRKFAPNRTSADWISRDNAVVDQYLADPMCNFPTRTGMNHAMMTGLQYISKKENLLRMDKQIPVGIFSGDADPVGGMGKGVEKVYNYFVSAGCEDVTMKLYPGARHEILNETNRQEVYGDLLVWLEDHR